MLDSGAFSVWTKGKAVNLTKYVDFCTTHPQFDYYVNLDVIPGRANDKKSLTKENIESSCQQGWDNYQNMIKELPRKKVLPVFHQNDPLSWLEKYLDDGVEYIGISPANDEGIKGRKAWMNGEPSSLSQEMSALRPLIFDKAGRRVVKTHGFGVTSYELMQFWYWHSVDSSTWQQAATWGEIFFPRKQRGVFDYSVSPYRIAVSDKSPHVAKFKKHGTTLTPIAKASLTEWLTLCGVTNEEAATDYDARLKVNATFVLIANEVLPVDHIYLAGFRLSYPLEHTLPYRLLSYHQLKVTQTYLEKLEDQRV